MNEKTLACSALILTFLGITVHAEFTCTERGPYADPDSDDCRSFVFCNNNSEYGGSLLYPEIMSCPENTKFNPVLQLCDSFYNCNGIDFHGGIDPCRSFNCSFISNPYVDDSSSYIDCVYYDNVVKAHKRIILREYCPDDTLFSPLLRQCYHNYDPNETCSKDACSTGPGKYVNYKSLNCESYIVCRNEGQTLSLYEPYYEIRYCPEGTRYNPETRKCSRKYVCPTPEENYCYPQISKATPQLATGPTEALLQRYRRLKMCRKS
ncbi:uncharacterized protein LOC119078673 [Bradysia coprophila]|uniref:uncharacterized protein LOC119078673 n=1 Tax=Bradysia coprophila TaxID=38358 RepID=UPI00187D743F|nr:uncharacterized protein LOC119078673 [Bradysia coprophila]